jgi:hypothetical protein
MKKPTNIKELRSYLGCFSHYRKFISPFSNIATPLYALTKKGNNFQWTEKLTKAFDTLRHRLATTRVPALYRDDAPIILYVDTSETGLGAVLSMLILGGERHLVYASRVLSNRRSIIVFGSISK